MKIKIFDTEYIMPRVTARMALRSYDIVDQGVQTETVKDEKAMLLTAIEFISNDVFAGQFTVDQFLDGYKTENLATDVFAMLGAIRGLLTDKLAEFPHADGDEEKNVKRGSKKK